MISNQFLPMSIPRRFAVPVLLTATTLLAVSVSSAQPLRAAQDEPVDESSAPLLIVPEDLIYDSLVEQAGEETARALSPQIETLFNANASMDERLQAAAQLRATLSGLSSMSLRSRLRRRVDVVEAGVKALQTSPPEDVRKLIVDLVAAVNTSELQNQSADAEIVRSNYRQLRASSPQVHAILKPVVMEYYYNHNLHLTVSETILARLVSDYQSKTGSIADCILGAWVTGSQVTNVSITADIKPSVAYGSFNLVANGQTTSSTVGRKKPALIYTRGNHHFRMMTPVMFTGDALTSGVPVININASNQTVGARTDYDGIPILGGIVRKIAMKKAQEARGQSEYIAAQKLASRAIPEFQQEVNGRFADANSQIQNDLLRGLRDKGVAPDTISSRSSETHLAISSRTLGLGRLAGTPQPFSPIPYRGLALQIHESAINNGIDGLELNGREIPEDQLADEVQKALGELLQRDINLSNMTAEVVEPAADGDEPPATFLFSDRDPIRMRFEDGRFVLMLRMGIRQEGKNDIPEHEIEVPIDLSLQGGKLVLTPPADVKEIKVAPVGRKTFRLVAQAAQIRRLLQSRLPQRAVDPSVTLPMSDTQSLVLQMIDVQTSDGWLYAEFQ